MSSPLFGVFNIKTFLRALLIILFPLLVGLLAGFLTKDSIVFYEVLNKLSLAPPPILFPIVWSILYLLSGIASFLVLRKGFARPDVKEAMYTFWLWLALSFLWPIVFFNFRAPVLAFIILIAMWIFVGITTTRFYRISKVAGFLLVPLWLWTTFAAYLNLAVILLN